MIKRQFNRCLAMSMLCFLMAPVHAEERGSAEQAKAMVQQTIVAMKKNGIDAVVADINKHDGQYRDRDLYVVVYDLKGKNLAHLNPKMVGKDLIELKDVDGKSFVKERIDIAKKKGSGWQDYKFLNPESKKIELKSMYIEKHDDVIVGCGIYK